jgi:hypothetical protein
LAQATWHSHGRGYRLAHGLFRGFKPPSEETAFLLAFGAIILAVVVLHARGAIKPRPEASPGVAIEAAALKPVEVAVAGPVNTQPVIPPPPMTAPLAGPPVAPSTLTLPAQAFPAVPIGAVDLETFPALINLATQTGTSFDPRLVTYGDLDGAGQVALVPLQSGGTAGTLAVAVLGVGKDGPQVLALLAPDTASRSRLGVTLDGGQLVMTQGVLGDEDPLCCPSQTRRTYYTWDGTRLQLQREVTTANPSAKN